MLTLWVEARLQYVPQFLPHYWYANCAAKALARGCHAPGVIG